MKVRLTITGLTPEQTRHLVFGALRTETGTYHGGRAGMRLDTILLDVKRATEIMNDLVRLDKTNE